MLADAFAGGPLGTVLTTMDASGPGFVPIMNASVRSVDPFAASTTAQAAMTMASAKQMGFGEKPLGPCCVVFDVGAVGHGCKKGARVATFWVAGGGAVEVACRAAS